MSFGSFDRRFVLAVLLVAFGDGARGQTPPLTPDIPAKWTAPAAAADYVKREVEVAMRDGVKLHTVIVVPRGAKNAPILLTRTPYNATEAHHPRAQPEPRGRPLQGYDNPARNHRRRRLHPRRAGHARQVRL